MGRKINRNDASHGLFAALDYLRNRRIPVWEKLIVIAVVLTYVISPVDMIPDVPVLGWLDDAGVLALFIAYCGYRIRRTQVEEAPDDDVIDAETVDEANSGSAPKAELPYK